MIISKFSHKLSAIFSKLIPQRRFTSLVTAFCFLVQAVFVPVYSSSISALDISVGGDSTFTVTAKSHFCPLQAKVDFLAKRIALEGYRNQETPEYYTNQAIRTSQRYAKDLQVNIDNFDVDVNAIGALAPLTSATELQRQIDFLVNWIHKTVLDDEIRSPEYFHREILQMLTITLLKI